MGKTEKAIFKVRIKGSIDDVWREITKTDEVQGCFFNNWMDVDAFKPGGKLRMRSKSRKFTGVVGEILAFDPPRRFSHTFKFTHLNDPPCKVTYELEELGGEVEFRMILDDVPAGTKTAKQMTQGGPMIVNSLKALVETGKLPLGTKLLFAFIGLMEPFSPASTRSENWK